MFRFIVPLANHYTCIGLDFVLSDHLLVLFVSIILLIIIIPSPFPSFSSAEEEFSGGAFGGNCRHRCRQLNAQFVGSELWQNVRYLRCQERRFHHQRRVRPRSGLGKGWWKVGIRDSQGVPGFGAPHHFCPNTRLPVLGVRSGLALSSLVSFLAFVPGRSLVSRCSSRSGCASRSGWSGVSSLTRRSLGALQLINPFLQFDSLFCFL